MKMTIQVNGRCECGWWVLFDENNNMTCPNKDCVHFGKSFKAPMIECVELPPVPVKARVVRIDETNFTSRIETPE